MSTKLRNNVKNVILGCQNFSEIIGCCSRLRNGFSQLAVQKSALSKLDSNYCNQDYFERRLSNYVKDAVPRGINQVSSELPVHCKWFDKVHTGPICTPKCPWKSSYRFYYERKDPQCPPKSTEPDCKVEPPKPCPPVKPVCPVIKQTKCHPCVDMKPKTSQCPKKCMCTVRSVSINKCRLFSGGCKPPGGPVNQLCGKKSSPCAEKIKAAKECYMPKGGKKGGDACAGYKQPEKTCYMTSGSKGGNPCGSSKPAAKKCYMPKSKSGSACNMKKPKCTK